jgi:hypothetical protein
MDYVKTEEGMLLKDLRDLGSDIMDGSDEDQFR